MEPFTTLNARVVTIPTDHIDTDQIIPARFLKTISKSGLGKNLFSDWRYDGEGQPNPDFPLNWPANQGAQILLAGDNFGCGSSREHAPWALTDYGIRAVISTSFADIFRNNALKNGLLPVVVDDETHEQLLSLAAEEPGLQLSIDLDTQLLILPDGRRISFPIDTFNKVCLLEGLDQLGYLLKNDPAIKAFESSHPSRIDTMARPLS
ncbi:MAG: 3-isopropylmalate dehydratase small subunit [Candidatus Promineofilum sp.]|uniref:3-isopropylmalate dehydratase small subunit n=1 Tax=Promineifilum sp. TaxID=2664178 RepID=UPI002411F697|nr:3-isopropylmalate dehydratase small subunit [Promineifilum sp.]